MPIKTILGKVAQTSLSSNLLSSKIDIIVTGQVLDVPSRVAYI